MFSSKNRNIIFWNMYDFGHACSASFNDLHDYKNEYSRRLREIIDGDLWKLPSDADEEYVKKKRACWVRVFCKSDGSYDMSRLPP